FLFQTGVGGSEPAELAEVLEREQGSGRDPGDGQGRGGPVGQADRRGGDQVDAGVPLTLDGGDLPGDLACSPEQGADQMMADVGEDAAADHLAIEPPGALRLT